LWLTKVFTSEDGLHTKGTLYRKAVDVEKLEPSVIEAATTPSA
jgi:hypothetical protein